MVIVPEPMNPKAAKLLRSESRKTTDKPVKDEAIKSLGPFRLALLEKRQYLDLKRPGATPLLLFARYFFALLTSGHPSLFGKGVPLDESAFQHVKFTLPRLYCTAQFT